jgi:hypothetical protein
MGPLTQQLSYKTRPALSSEKTKGFMFFGKNRPNDGNVPPALAPFWDLA